MMPGSNSWLPNTLPEITNARLRLEGYHVGHSTLFLTVQAIGIEAATLIFVGVKYINLPTEFQATRIRNRMNQYITHVSPLIPSRFAQASVNNINVAVVFDTPTTEQHIVLAEGFQYSPNFSFKDSVWPELIDEALSPP